MSDETKKVIGDFLFEAENIAYNMYIHTKGSDKEVSKYYLLWRTFFDIIFRTWRRNVKEG